MVALTRKHNTKIILDTLERCQKQWTVEKGVETGKPVMWSSRAQMLKYAALKRRLKAALSTSEASRRSTEEYSTPDDDYSVTPDTDDYSVTSCEATSQYEVTDEALPGTTDTPENVRRVNKAMFHMEHLRHEMNRWYLTTQKH